MEPALPYPALVAAFILAVAAPLAAPAAAPVAAQGAGDPAAGAKLFAARCSVCHAKAAQGGALAPALIGVVGVKAAAGTFPRYSAALKASQIVWTEAKLDSFLTAPGKLVPGTMMVVAVPSATDRADIVAHLRSLKP